MNNNPIGILDSGIGGVTVLKEIIKLLPNENYIYYSDSINNPYGEKTKEEIINYVEEIVDYFVSKKCKAIVFACNTATNLAIDEIRDKYKDLIIIGTYPACKMAYDLAYSKKVVVMATKATINSSKFKDLYNKYNNGNTNLLPCSNLAKLIEDESNEIDDYLYSLLKNYQDTEVVILGCTHYPLIKDKISKILNKAIFYDGGSGVSRRLKYLLEENNLLNNTNKQTITFIDSSNSKEKETRFYKFLNK